MTPEELASVPHTRGAGSAAAPAHRRVWAQGLFEARMILRNGEQLMITILLPVIILIGLVQTELIALDTSSSRVDFITPGVLALAVMTTSFTSQAIATAFDRRNGVLRLLATTPLGRSGLLGAKILGVLLVEVVQVLVLGTVAVIMGWRPEAIGIPLAILAALLGTAAFTALALLIAGTLRAEGVLAVANILLVLLIVGGGVLIPVANLPGPLMHAAIFLPSGALGEAMRGALLDGAIPLISIIVLVGWTVGLTWATTRFFRWQ